VDAQMVHEAISLNNSFLNALTIYRNNTGKKKWSAVIQNSVTWRTVCEVYKCAGMQNASMIFFRQHSTATNWKIFYKQASTF
jgi:hypothetical protein